MSDSAAECTETLDPRVQVKLIDNKNYNIIRTIDLFHVGECRDQFKPGRLVKKFLLETYAFLLM